MTRDDVIRMAREAGLLIPSFRIDSGLALGICTVPDFERFASLVAAAEREECAVICEHGWKTGIGEKHQGDVFATAIRARGNQ